MINLKLTPQAGFSIKRFQWTANRRSIPIEKCLSSKIVKLGILPQT